MRRITWVQSRPYRTEMIIRIGTVAIFQRPVESFSINIIDPNDIGRVIGRHFEHWSWRRTNNLGFLATSQPRPGKATIVKSCCSIWSTIFGSSLNIYHINILFDLRTLRMFDLRVGDEVRVLFEVVLGAYGTINMEFERRMSESYLTFYRLLSVYYGQEYQKCCHRETYCRLIWENIDVCGNRQYRHQQKIL